MICASVCLPLLIPFPFLSSEIVLYLGRIEGFTSELVHIRPGKPVENALVESFNGRLREECLNMSWFRNLFDARRQIEAWRDHYNRARPHSALDYRTPAEFAALRAAVQSSAGAREGASNAGPFPHTSIPAQTGDPIDESCRMLE